jgi:hypothetical protein
MPDPDVPDDVLDSVSAALDDAIGANPDVLVEEQPEPSTDAGGESEAAQRQIETRYGT